MKKSVFVFSLIILIVLVFTGCASILSKSNYPVTISSNPDVAEITIKNSSEQNVFKGKTPATITLKAGAGFFKGENYTVAFQKAGYGSYEATITRGIDGWYFGNLLFGGLIGILIVDPATGAMWTLKDLHVELSLEEAGLKDEQLKIVSIDEIPKELHSRLTRVK